MVDQQLTLRLVAIMTVVFFILVVFPIFPLLALFDYKSKITDYSNAA